MRSQLLFCSTTAIAFFEGFLVSTLFCKSPKAKGTRRRAQGPLFCIFFALGLTPLAFSHTAFQGSFCDENPYLARPIYDTFHHVLLLRQS